MSAAASYEAVVVGGGPAGATAARLLARRGHRVLVLARSRPPDQRLFESLPPSCRKLFRHVGIEDLIDRAGFEATTGNTVWWGATQPRVETFADGATGWQVPAADLETLLLERALAAGAEVRAECTARGAGGLDTDPPTPWVEIDSTGERGRRIHADWIVDATGRAGLLARRAGRRRLSAATTLALASAWRSGDAWDVPDPSHTLVESYADGWAWSVPISTGERFFTVMVDPRHSILAPGGDRETLYRGEIAKTTAFSSLLARAERVGALLACDASPYTSEVFGGPGWLVCGDAGSFLDPLSSFGVKKAVASGWLASVSIHTALVEPELAGAALELFDRRERQVFASHRRLAASYFGSDASGRTGAYWEARADLADDALAFAGGPDVAALREDAEVLEAFALLRSLRSLRLAIAPETSLVPRPLVQDERVALAEHVVAPWCPEGLRYLRDIALPDVVRLAPAARSVPDLFEAYAAEHPGAALADFLGALSVCLAKGLLLRDPTL